MSPPHGHCESCVRYLFWMTFTFLGFCDALGAAASPPPIRPCMPAGSCPPICCIICDIMSSLTPPPDNAGECNGRILPIFEPRGIAGGMGLPSFGIGSPGTCIFKGVFSSVGCDLRYSDISLYRWCSGDEGQLPISLKDPSPWQSYAAGSSANGIAICCIDCCSTYCY